MSHSLSDCARAGQARPQSPRVTKRTPWGERQAPPEWLSPEVYFAETPSHGGYHLGPELQRELAETFPHFRPHTGTWEWLEEDCDWLPLAIVRPELFSAWSTARLLDHARKVARGEAELAASGRMRNWTPSNWAHVVEVADARLAGKGGAR